MQASHAVAPECMLWGKKAVCCLAQDALEAAVAEKNTLQSAVWGLEGAGGPGEGGPGAAQVPQVGERALQLLIDTDGMGRSEGGRRIASCWLAVVAGQRVSAPCVPRRSCNLCAYTHPHAARLAAYLALGEVVR